MCQHILPRMQMDSSLLGSHNGTNILLSVITVRTYYPFRHGSNRRATGRSRHIAGRRAVIKKFGAGGLMTFPVSYSLLAINHGRIFMQRRIWCDRPHMPPGVHRASAEGPP